jgi:hypothetical protein
LGNEHGLEKTILTILSAKIQLPISAAGLAITMVRVGWQIFLEFHQFPHMSLTLMSLILKL